PPVVAAPFRHLPLWPTQPQLLTRPERPPRLSSMAPRAFHWPHYDLVIRLRLQVLSAALEQSHSRATSLVTTTSRLPETTAITSASTHSAAEAGRGPRQEQHGQLQMPQPDWP